MDLNKLGYTLGLESGSKYRSLSVTTYPSWICFWIGADLIDSSPTDSKIALIINCCLVIDLLSSHTILGYHIIIHLLFMNYNAFVMNYSCKPLTDCLTKTDPY